MPGASIHEIDLELARLTKHMAHASDMQRLEIQGKINHWLEQRFKLQVREPGTLESEPVTPAVPSGQ